MPIGETKRETIGSGAKGVLFAALGVFALIVIFDLVVPNYVDPQRRIPDPRASCVNNLRHIDGAKQLWAFAAHAPSNAIPTWEDIKPYLGRGTNNPIPKCPAGGVYTIGPLNTDPTCSIKGHALN